MIWSMRQRSSFNTVGHITIKHTNAADLCVISDSNATDVIVDFCGNFTGTSRAMPAK
jgi:hypothetical protein